MKLKILTNAISNAPSTLTPNTVAELRVAEPRPPKFGTRDLGFRDTGLGARDLGLDTVLNTESLIPDSIFTQHKP